MYRTKDYEPNKSMKLTGEICEACCVELLIRMFKEIGYLHYCGTLMSLICAADGR